MDIDALEAVRRLTLERDALAEQVKRLEADMARMEYRRRLEDGDALQAPVRREQPETGTEPHKDPNGAPRGCMVLSCVKCLRLWEECDRLSRSIGWGSIAQK